MTGFKEKIKSVKFFNWKLFFSLVTLSLIPAIYLTIKTAVITSIESDNAFDIIGQMEWFDLINETLLAFLIVPLYSVLNLIFKNNLNNFAKYAFKFGLLITLIYAIFSIIILIYGIHLIKQMNGDSIDIAITNTYLQLETVAFMISIILNFSHVVFVVVGKAKNIYIFLGFNVLLSTVIDFVLIPNIGIYGVAISNIIVNALLATVALGLLFYQKYLSWAWFHKKDWYFFKMWSKVGFFSGLQQFIDNFIYAIMVVKMVNLINEQGNYWIANNFIWGWLLIPMNALGEIIRRDCKNGYFKIRQFNYYFITMMVILIWLISIPLWTPFYRYVENLNNANQIFNITIKLFPFYIFYAGCVIIDNIFIGLGKTFYNTINSLIINIIYYGVFYILYLTNAMTFNMNTIILMFGFGMVFHWLISLVLEKWFLKRFLKKQESKLINK